MLEQPDLDWGMVTPEGYDAAKKEALHVLNVLLIGDENHDRVLEFTCARVRHFNRHLPTGSSQRVLFDLRGQSVGNKKLEQIRQTVVQDAASHDIQVSVEILTN